MSDRFGGRIPGQLLDQQFSIFKISVCEYKGGEPTGTYDGNNEEESNSLRRILISADRVTEGGV
jgi:hypothetical protein